MSNHTENAHQFKYWEVSTQAVIDHLASKRGGLVTLEAQKRLRQNGKNELQVQEQKSAWAIFLSQFKSPLVLILLGASLLSGILGDMVSTIVIVLIILLSAVLAFVQEHKSEQIINKLRKKVALKTSVLRDDKVSVIHATELVTGDVILLEPGNVVPADMRLIYTDELMINEAVLTGESFPVEKKSFAHKVHYYLPQSMQNLAFAGTHVTQGSGRGIVIATGKDTELGKAAHLMQQRPGETEFQKGIKNFGLFLFRIILIFTLAVFLFLAIFRHDWIESLLFALAIAVGISPELLPVIITINLSQGARAMSQKQVITKRLMSIEDLGNADILCTDKTGTLTAGNIVLKDFFDFDQQKNDEVLKKALLCNTFNITKDVVGNPLDEAIWAYGKKHHQIKITKDYTLIDSLVFNFERRRMSVVMEDKNAERWLITKGAAEEMLDVCSHLILKNKNVLLKAHLTQIKQTLLKLQNQGFKILLVAQRKIEKHDQYTSKEEKEMTLIGYLVFNDPLKKTAKNSLAGLKNLGVEVKVLTGDTEPVTRHLLEEIDFNITGILSGDDLQKLTDQKLQSAAEKANVFVKITPEHKLRIINALKKKGHTVGFLGDGVNDAPALRAADVGISVDSAVDIAKEAADIILMQKNLTVLSDGIVEGRKTFSNTLKYIYCTISSNYGNMFSVAGAALILPFIPMLPVQILLLNFLSDFPMLAIATDKVDEEDLKKPKHWNIKIISKFMIYFGLVSSVFDFITFGFLLWAFGRVAPVFQAGWFWESFLTEVVLIFVIRTRRLFWRSKSSRTLLVTSVLCALAVLLFIYSPLRHYFGFANLPVDTVVIILTIAIAYFVVVEIGKKIFYKKFDI